MAAQQLTVLLMTEPDAPKGEESEEVGRFAVPAVSQWAVEYGLSSTTMGAL